MFSQLLLFFVVSASFSCAHYRKAIDHFEYVWQRTHGMEANTILKECHLALRKDCALYLYEETLKIVPIFVDMLPTFYRTVGIQIEEKYFLKDYRIIELNDIVKNVFIVHKGEVTIIGPDGSCFAVLGRGRYVLNLNSVTEWKNCVEDLSII